MNMGIGGEIYLNSTDYEFNDETASKTILSLNPFIRLELSEATFIEPFISYYTKTENDDNGFNDVDIEANKISSSWGFGITMGKVAYKNKILSLNYGLNTSLTFGIEPTGDSATEYDSYSDIWFNAKGFISFDLSLTKNLKIRIGQNILSFYSSKYSTEKESYKYTKTNYNFDTVWSGFSPVFSIYYML